MNNNLKALSQTENELRVGNYIVLFGGKDLTGEFFTQKTAFDSSYTDIGLLYVDFEHGNDAEKAGNSRSNVLGIVDWSTAKADDKGIFVERVLNRRAKYVRYLEELITAGVIGTSSEADPRGVSKKSSGEIVDWPLVRDSLTVTPLEPRMAGENVLTAAKALVEAFPASKSLAALAGIEINEPETGLKAIEALQDLKTAEDFLRDSGISKREAVAFVSRVKSLSRSDSGDDMKALLAAIQARQVPINPNTGNRYE